MKDQAEAEKAIRAVGEALARYIESGLGSISLNCLLEWAAERNFTRLYFDPESQTLHGSVLLPSYWPDHVQLTVSVG